MENRLVLLLGFIFALLLLSVISLVHTQTAIVCAAIGAIATVCQKFFVHVKGPDHHDQGPKNV